MIDKWTVVGAASLALATGVWAEGNDPAVPAGRDRGGVAIAIVGAGVDYTNAGVADHLARDGEGQLIGWDFVDDDDRPYARSASVEPRSVVQAVLTLSRLTAAGSGRVRARLVPARVDVAGINAGETNTLKAAIAYLARTPVRVVVLEGIQPVAGLREIFDVVRRHRPAVLFIFAASRVAKGARRRPTEGQPAFPDNVLWADGHLAEVLRAAAELLAQTPEIDHARLRAGIERLTPVYRGINKGTAK